MACAVVSNVRRCRFDEHLAVFVAVEHHCEQVFRNRRAGEKVEICAIREEKRTDISGDIRQRGRDSWLISAPAVISYVCTYVLDFFKLSGNFNLPTVGHV